LAQEITIAEAAMTVLREGRVIRHLALQAQAAEPAIGQVQMHFLAEPALRANAEAIADEQHPDHQLRVDRRTSDLAVEGPQVSAHAGTGRRTDRSDAASDRPERAVRVKTRRTAPPARPDFPPSSRSLPAPNDQSESATSNPRNPWFSNEIGANQPIKAAGLSACSCSMRSLADAWLVVRRHCRELPRPHGIDAGHRRSGAEHHLPGSLHPRRPGTS